MILGLVAVLVAGVAGWFLADDSVQSEADGRKPGIAATTAPAVGGNPGGGPATTGASGQTTPADINRPVRPPASAAGPGATAAPGATATVKPTATEGEAPDDDPPAATTPPPPPEGKRLTSPGGSVSAVCAGVKATLSSWEPAEGYAVQKVDAGPAVTTSIVFAATLTRYRMTVTCVAGTPTPVVLPL